MIRLIARTAAGLALSAMVGGCSQLYLDRRDAIALGAGDAVAANMAAQTADPWPRQSGNTNLAFNGQRMQSAVERYRTNNIVPPQDSMALQTGVSAPAASPSSNGTPNNNTNNNNSSASGSGAPAPAAAVNTAQ